MRRALLFATAAGILTPVAAMADHPFVLPSNTTFSGLGNTATFDAAGSDHVFFFDHRPLLPETLRVERPDGTTIVPQATRTRFRTVFDLPLDEAGTWKATSAQTGVTGSFMLDGVERRVGGRGPAPAGGGAGVGGAGGDRPAAGGAPAPETRRPGDRAQGSAAGEPPRLPPVAVEDIPANATDVRLTEQIATTETFVSVDAPTRTVFAPTGHGLEIDWVTHPNSLVAGEPARFRLLVDGRPTAGVEVVAIPGGDRYRASDDAVRLRSAADGAVSLRWPAAGMWWLGAETQDSHPSAPRAQGRRMTYAATLEVAAP